MRVPGTRAAGTGAIATSTSVVMPTGTLRKNTARQDTYSVRSPPMSGPSATKIWLMPAKIAMARPRSPGPNEAMTMAPETGTISAAPAP